jgi:hypothetical protein
MKPFAVAVLRFLAWGCFTISVWLHAIVSESGPSKEQENSK